MKNNLLHLMNGVAICALLSSGFAVDAAQARESNLSSVEAISEPPVNDQSQDNKLPDAGAAIKKTKSKKQKVAPTPASAPAEGATEVVVRGVRASLRKSRDAKRRSQQIVDVVTADDLGKLPDKNVPDALSRIAGIVLDRSRGEGSDFAIRGLYGAMTTVNGTPSFSGTSRTSNLSDMPADLVSSIQVYKSRTPDQVEGSKAGVVNLELRKPTDFKPGLTVALNARGDYSDQVEKINPFYSALVAYNKDTSIGKMGFVLSGSHNYVQYELLPV